MKALALPFLVLALAACATTSGSADSSGQDFAWQSQDAPPLWTALPWVFVVSDLNGHLLRSVTLKFTDESASTCVPGDWKKVVILGQEPQAQPSPELPPDEAAYRVEGSALVINFTSNFCDAYTAMEGQISKTGFSGKYSFSDLMGSKDLGVAYGARVHR